MTYVISVLSVLMDLLFAQYFILILRKNIVYKICPTFKVYKKEYFFFSCLKCQSNCTILLILQFFKEEKKL